MNLDGSNGRVSNSDYGTWAEPKSPDCSKSLYISGGDLWMKYEDGSKSDVKLVDSSTFSSLGYQCPCSIQEPDWSDVDID